MQIHWITLEVMPEILERLEQVGLTTIGACGDVTRTIIGCTVAGIAHDEIVDGYTTAVALHAHFLGNRLYSNLPRKFKISVAGCAEDCARGLINDVALSGAIAGDGVRGFNLRVGGGLSAVPRMARWVDVFVTPEEACEVVEQVTAIFRDAEENRKRAARPDSSSRSTASDQRPSAASLNSGSAGRCAAAHPTPRISMVMTMLGSPLSVMERAARWVSAYHEST